MPPFSRSFAAAVLLSLSFCLPISAQTNVLTQHNDIGRTGQNITETVLTPTNVSSGNFGKVGALPLDGDAYAQPLYMSNLEIGGINHSVVFIATEHDSVYAFDAGAGGQQLWKATMLDAAHGAAAGAIPDPESDTGCNNVNGPEYGIMGTPVIDPATNTMYVVSLTYENNYPLQRLHALDVTNGNEKFGGPVTIAATVAGTGSGSSNGELAFDAKWNNQRAGLLLINGTVYIAWASHCDEGPWHGWLMGYNASTLAQNGVFVTTPNGAGSGIWMSGSGLAADIENGVPRMFIPTGNGTYDATTPYGTNTMDYGDDILRLNLANGIQVADAFTPSNQAVLAAGDMDVAAGGLIVLPDNLPGSSVPHEAVQMGKSGIIYLLNRENLGGYNTVDKPLQSVAATIFTTDGIGGYGYWGMPAYWNNNLYFWPAQSLPSGNLLQYSISNGLMSTSPVAMSSQSDTWQGNQFWGATPSISASGNTNGILWVDDTGNYNGGVPQYFYALDATNVANTLWSSNTNPARDNAGIEQKYTVPTIADGRVFLMASQQLLVYGLLDFSMTVPNSVSVNPGNNTATIIGLTSSTSFTQGVTFSASALPSGVSVSFTQSVNGSATALFTAAANAATGTSNITISATRGTTTQTTTMVLTVGGLSDFALSAAPASVQLGTTAFSAITVTPQNGFTGVPSYLATSLPAGVSASFTGCSITGCTMLLTASPVMLLGSFPVTIQASSGTLVHSVSTTVTVSRSGYTNVDMSKFYNVNAIATDGNPPSNGGVDQVGYAFSGKLLGTSQNWAGTTFTLGAPDVADAVSGQTVTLPAGNFVNLQYLASGGGASEEPMVVTYTDGSTSTSTQSYSNWGAPGNNAGESEAITDAYRILPNGSTQSGPWYIYGYTLPLNSGKTVSSVTLPPTRQVIVMAMALSSSSSVPQTIFFNPIAAQQAGSTITLNATASSGLVVAYTSSTQGFCTVSGNTVSLPAAGTCTIVASQAGSTLYAPAGTVTQSFTITPLYQAAVNLAGVYNVSGFFNSGTAPTNGGLDGTGYAYAGNLFGKSAMWGGFQFTFGATGVADAVSSATIPLPAGSFSSLQMLATGAFGNQVTQPFVITYSDGTKTTFTQSLSDWGAPSSNPGESIALNTAYRITPSGATQSYAWNTYGYSFPLNSAKTLTSIAMPNNRNVVVVAMTLSSTSPIAQLISFGAIANQSLNASFSLTATASSGLPVTFASTTAGTCTVSAGLVTTVGAGTCTITASQAGNANYAAALPVSQSFTIKQAGQTITFAAIGTQTAATSITLSATATSGLPISFASSTGSICTVAGSSASLLSAGTCTITASQPGNNAYPAATPVSQSFTVNLHLQAISFAAVSTQRALTSISLAATASSGLPVTYTASPSSACSVSGSTLSLLATGTCTATATQGGSGAYAAATAVSQSITVVAPQVQVSLSSSFNVAAIFNNGSTVTNGGLDGAGYAFSANLLGTSATWDGAKFNLGATASGGVALVKVPLPSGTFASLQVLATGVNGSPVNQPFVVTYSDGSSSTFTQSISDWGNYPLGYAGESIAVSTPYRLTSNGSSQSLGVVWNIYGYSFALNSAKTVSSITLPNNRNVVVMAMTLSPPPISQTVAFSAVPSQVVGTPVSLTASATSGLAVVYSSSTTGVCSVSGSTATMIAAGTCTITASQAGNSNYAAATAVSQSFTVTSH